MQKIKTNFDNATFAHILLFQALLRHSPRLILLN